VVTILISIVLPDECRHSRTFEGSARFDDYVLGETCYQLLKNSADCKLQEEFIIPPNMNILNYCLVRVAGHTGTTLDESIHYDTCRVHSAICCES
jgi:hypothetical protein